MVAQHGQTQKLFNCNKGRMNECSDTISLLSSVELRPTQETVVQSRVMNLYIFRA
jgi:hypothetical protein